MRLSSLFILLGTFAAAAGIALVAALFSVELIEDSSVAGVREELTEDGLDWADADANGLQLFVIGTAPTEADRFRAVAAAGRVVDAARVIDETLVAEAEDVRPPRFSIEILRNEATASLIGLVPAEFDRARLAETVSRTLGNDGELQDLLESADFPAPDGWNAAIRFATRALEDLPRAKISVAADGVAIKAMAESAEARRQLQSELNRVANGTVPLELDISAPRPVITPFTLRFVKDDIGARFDACSADTDEARAAILAAARAAGAAEGTGCVIGLGVPSRDWGTAAASAIDAIDALGGGALTFTNTDISLIAAEGTAPRLYDEVIGRLENALPESFVLEAVLPEPPDPEADQGPVEFSATLSPEGLVQLRGRLGSEVSRTTVESFAQAAFGSTAVTVGARIDDSLTQSWSARVLAGIEALTHLANGAVVVGESNVSVSGNTGDVDASSKIAALLTEKLGTENFDISVRYQERLDPTLGIPTPQECVAQIRTIIGNRKITFEPGAATLDASAKDILDEVAELLQICGEIPLEIQGHTDSQGREQMNQQLSQSRAEEVLDALRNRRVLTASYRAVGYGEAEPIAENDSEEGREANRRIEFTLRADETAEAEDGAEAAEDADGETGPQDVDTDAASDAEEDSAAEDEEGTSE